MINHQYRWESWKTVIFREFTNGIAFTVIISPNLVSRIPIHGFIEWAWLQNKQAIVMGIISDYLGI